MSVLCPKDKKEFQDIISQHNDQLYVVDFFAVWCGPCKITAPKFEKLAEEFGNKIVCLKIDVDKEEDLANDYDITVMPTFVLIKNAAQIGKVEGTKLDVLRQAILENTSGC